MKKFIENHLIVSILLGILLFIIGLYFTLEIINPYFYSNFKDKYILKNSEQGLTTYENIDEQKTISGIITSYNNNILEIRSSNSVNKVKIDSNTSFNIVGNEGTDITSKYKIKVGENVSVRLVDPIYRSIEPYKAEAITIVPEILANN